MGVLSLGVLDRKRLVREINAVLHYSEDDIELGPSIARRTWNRWRRRKKLEGREHQHLLQHSEGEYCGLGDDLDVGYIDAEKGHLRELGGDAVEEYEVVRLVLEDPLLVSERFREQGTEIQVSIAKWTSRFNAEWTVPELARTDYAWIGYRFVEVPQLVGVRTEWALRKSLEKCVMDKFYSSR